jgi:hypothetical protein
VRTFLALLLLFQAATSTSRGALVASAVDAYRTGEWVAAVDAFTRVGTFEKGEEHLRFYHAVALFETGRYDDAKKELACALPFIEETDDVLRYRAKIDGMAAVTP